MATVSSQNDYYGAVRDAARALWNANNTLVELQRQWNALDYGSTLPNGEGINEGVLATELGAVVFATADAIVGVLNAGHATNLAKLL